MRILNLEAPHFVSSWREQGHQVLAIGSHKAADVPIDRVISGLELWGILQKHAFMPDLVVWCDDCRPPSVIGFEQLPAVCVGFSIDQYCNPWHVPYSAGFDFFLLAQKDYVSLFEGHNQVRKAFWFPLFCDPHKDRDLKRDRDIPVSFVGTLDTPLNPGRAKLLSAFRKHHPLVILQGNYVPVFNRSRIVLNQSAVGELNFRLFQAAACGALVLNEDVPNGLIDLFVPGREVALYPRGDAHAAARICRDLLSDPCHVRDMAAAGRDKVLANHTTGQRARFIVNQAMAKETARARHVRLDNPSPVRTEMAKAFSMLATDENLPLPRDMREFYLNLSRKYLSTS